MLMLAFDSLYHSRAWVMLLLNVVQLLFSIFCLVQGTAFGPLDAISVNRLLSRMKLSEVENYPPESEGHTVCMHLYPNALPCLFTVPRPKHPFGTNLLNDWMCSYSATRTAWQLDLDGLFDIFWWKIPFQGVPLLVRLGVVTDGVFFVLGYLSFPRAFFGDMRARSPHKQWLFDTYLKRPKTQWACPKRERSNCETCHRAVGVFGLHTPMYS